MLSFFLGSNIIPFYIKESGMGKTHESLKNKQWLFNKYIVEKKTIADIAVELYGKIIKTSSIHRWLKNHKIKLRKAYGSDKQLGNWNKGLQKSWDKKRGSGKGYYYLAGYRMIYKPDHPSARKSGWIFEHRFVIENILGRSLLKKEIVHHKNKVRDDNRPENLILIEIGKPNAHELSCPKCNFTWMIK